MKQFGVSCWLFGIGQITIAFIRPIERGKQLAWNPEALIDPLRKQVPSHLSSNTDMFVFMLPAASIVDVLAQVM